MSAVTLGLAGLACCLPVWLVVWAESSGSLHLGGYLGAFFVCTNTIVRLCFPSSFCPASQSRRGVLCSPLLARSLATVSEFAFYEAEAEALGLPFWTGWLGVLTILGETLC